MTMTPRLELRQGQALVMTPRLQQALKMLRMSNQELGEHVAGLVEANPLLEPVRLPRRLDFAPRGDGPSAVDLAEASETLREHLLRQVGATRGERPVLAAAAAVVEELEADGYLRVPLEEVVSRHRLDPDAAQAGLALVQGLDPAGVGARTLGECLTLQLADRGQLDAAMAAVIENLSLLASGGVVALAQACGMPEEALAAKLKLLRAVDPKPGARFGDAPVSLVVPDVLVRRSSTGWDVEVNGETLPRVLMNNVYNAKLGLRDKTARAYISECRVQAVWLIRSLEQRARTILKVTTAIVGHQEAFFSHGVRGLKPLNQRTVADRIGLHESTVSRVTAQKYLSCERGIFSLRSFFSQGLETISGEAVSSAAVQDRIRSIIAAEGAKRILSDDRIVSMLHGEGIDIARRTVAKYRDGMGIPSSVERRRLKGSGGAT
jgi:RNA polymerase sigma-54 factor